jgi:hypothetical protein
MSRLFQWLNFAALCLVAFALSSELLTGVRPGTRVALSAHLYAEGEQAGSIRLYRFPKARLDPVEITKVREGGTAVVPGVYRVPPYDTVGEPIPYSDDWIKNLSYTFKNVTFQKIQFMWLAMSFHYGDHDNWQTRVTWNLDLGEVPPLSAEIYYTSRGTKIPQGTGRSLGLRPGEEMTVSLSEYADKIRARIEAVTPLSSVNECCIAVALVYFDQPGLKWGNYGFGWAVADPDSPNGYRRLLGPPFPLDVDHASWDKAPKLEASPSN